MEIRGRGRGRGGNPSITSRLSGFNDNDSFNNNYYQNYANPQNGGQRGRGGRGGNRGRGQRGRGGGGSGGSSYNYDGDASMNGASTGPNVEVIVSGYPPGQEADLLEFVKRKSKRQWQPLQTQILEDGFHLLVQDQITASSITRLNGYTYQGQNITIVQLGGTPAPIHSSHNNQPAMSSLDTLRQFLHQRWNPEQKFLNLEKMGLDPLYKKVAHSAADDLRPAMFKLAAESFGDIITVSLSSNRMRNLHPIAALADYLPNLQNLSLHENNITTYSDIEPLAGKFNNLNELVLTENPVRNRDLERNGNDVNYRSEVTRRFPSLKLLDGIPVAQAIQFDVQAADLEATAKLARLPARVKGNFFDQESSQMAANDFLARFFQTFDVNRAALFDLYDDTALFSVSVSVSFNPKHRGKGAYANNSGANDWRDISRNLVRNKALKRRVECLYYGPTAIVQLITTMPSTVHNLRRADNFVTDAWQMGGFTGYPAVLFVKVHGEFSEGTAPNSQKYSFDRVFIVGPAGPGSRAQNAGWQYVILSDQWHIRDLSGNKAFQPEPEQPHLAFSNHAEQSLQPFGQPFPQPQAPTPHILSFPQTQPNAQPVQSFPQTQATPQLFAQPSPSFNTPAYTPPVAPQPQLFTPAQAFTPPSAQSTPPPAPPPTPQVNSPASERAPGLTDQQHMQVLELRQQTGLNYSFALQCLAENEWNLRTAIDSYERLKNINAIPPAAYNS